MKTVITTVLFLVISLGACAHNPSMTLPEKSKIVIEGSYGCFVGCPYSLEIKQDGEAITIQGQNNLEKFSKDMSLEEYEIFWSSLLELHPFELQDEYGQEVITGAFFGTLLIEYTDNNETLSKEVTFIKGILKDIEFEKVYNVIMDLLEENQRIP